ncbi:MAG: hypothetical protein HY842_00075 [Bacteroidetes bacterium]|nr:hypothetical protein [Bacteroidota bacterium]
MLIQITYVLNGVTKTETVDALKLADTKLALPSNVPIAGRNRQNMGQASLGYVQDCIAAAIAHPEVPSGSIDVPLLESKLATIMEMDDVLAVLEPLYTETLNCRRLHGQDIMNACNEIKRSFEYNANNKAEYKATADKLKQRYARARKEETQAAKEAKAAKAAAEKAAKEVQNGVPVA